MKSNKKTFNPSDYKIIKDADKIHSNSSDNNILNSNQVRDAIVSSIYSLIGNENVPTEILDKLYFDKKYSYFKSGIINNKNISDKIENDCLVHLYDNSLYYQYSNFLENEKFISTNIKSFYFNNETNFSADLCLLENPNTPTEVIMDIYHRYINKLDNYIVNDEIGTIYNKDGYSCDNTYFYKKLLNHPNFPVDLINDLVSDDNNKYIIDTTFLNNDELNLIAKESKDFDNDESYKKHLDNLYKSGIAKIHKLNNPNAIKFRVLAMTNPNIDVNILIKYSKDKNPWVRMNIALNPNTPKEILDELSMDENRNVRLFVSENKSTDSKTLEKMILNVLCLNKGFNRIYNIQVLDVNVYNNDNDVEYLIFTSALRNSNLSSDFILDLTYNYHILLNDIIYDKNYKYNIKIPNIYVKVLKGLALNPNATKEVLSLINDMCDKFYDLKDIKDCIVRNKNVDKNILLNVLSDKYYYDYKYHYSALMNPAFSNDDLLNLLYELDSSNFCYIIHNTNIDDNLFYIILDIIEYIVDMFDFKFENND